MPSPERARQPAVGTSGTIRVRVPAISRGVTAATSWSDSFLAVLKDSDIRLVAYVPDNALTRLLNGVTAENYFMPVGTAFRQVARSPFR